MVLIMIEKVVILNHQNMFGYTGNWKLSKKNSIFVFTTLHLTTKQYQKNKINTVHNQTHIHIKILLTIVIV